ncbi:UDP-N-acetylmuramate dehydrogenase [uncultured Slackia sp.]|uniref:UDP-N-acetylmuramate dehydrogenase n=1 Tax=uncultured Slackia sp. TaxID=665903 RepID=UPI0025CD5406|nr:UDP-N-acetylmuramate dehydrogenase [uncultured Slackia sp.]
MLARIVGEENVRANEPMNAHTTFQIGGPADVYVAPRSAEQVAAIVKACREADAPLAVVGNGSDLLVADEGLRCVVMQILDNMADVRVEGTRIVAQAGATNAQVARAALEAELAGFEFASGIPGTVGGAAIMNAGAYGGEFKDVCMELACVTPDGEFVRVSREDADWSYRHSMMGDAGYIVVEAMLELAHDEVAAIKERMDDLKARREEKQPLEMPSAGSTFKRPEGYFAGKLIQDAGLRGYRVGGAQVSEKHTGFVVNAGGATAADVRQLIADVQDRVFEQFGVRLEPEVKMWGFGL